MDDTHSVVEPRSETCERLREELASTRESVREADERFHTVLGQSIDVIYRRNLLTDRYDYLSPAAERITGFAVDELARMSSADLMRQIHPEDREVAEAHLRQFEKGRDGAPGKGLFEYRLRCKDGGYRWISDSCGVVFGQGGEPLYHVGVARDVTARKEAEAALIASLRAAEEATSRLRASEEQIRFLSDNLPGVLLYQIDCGVDGSERKFTYLSSGVEQLHELSVAEAMKTPYAIYTQLFEEDCRAFAELERAAIETCSMFRAETRIILPSGITKWILIVSIPRRAPNNHLIWDGFELDITESKRHEVELRRHSEDLERAVAGRTARLRRLASELARAEQRERRRLSEFLHDDLQQILVAAKYSAEGLASSLPEGSAEGQARKLLNHLADAVGSVRAYSVGMTTPLLYVVGLAPALRDLAEQMQGRYGLRVDYEVGELPEVKDEAVKAQVYHAVRELLFNAAKHSGAASVRLHGGYAEGRLALTVSDEGKGFVPGAVLGGGASGGGFGLFSVGERLGDLGGELRIESSPGCGTSVSLSLPVPAEPAAGPRAVLRTEPCGDGRAAEAAAGRRARVLVADDHDLVRAGVANLLAQDQRLEVVGAAKNGREAVALARQLLPDVIVMDIRMPEMDGIEATRLILSERPEVVVVGISAFGDDGFRDAMLGAGAVDLLDKVDAGARLVTRIAECLAQRRMGAKLSLV